jgi:hypothetical protein
MTVMRLEAKVGMHVSEGSMHDALHEASLVTVEKRQCSIFQRQTSRSDASLQKVCKDLV